MPAKLIFYRGNDKFGIDLKDGVYRIGRDKPADVVIPDPTVSGNHAELQIEGNTFQIRDLGSTNGTFLNETPLRAITVLKPTDALRLGSVRVTIEPIQQQKQEGPPAARVAAEAAAEKVAAVRGAASKLTWGMRYFLGGAFAVFLLMLLFLFVQVYTEQSAAQRRQANRYKAFAAQYMHVLADPSTTEIPAPVLDATMTEPIIVGDRTGRVLYPPQPPGSKQPSPFINPKTGQPWDSIKVGLVPYPEMAGPGEAAPISYPVQAGGDLRGFVLARPAPDEESSQNFVLMVLVFSGGIALLLLFFLLRPTSTMIRREMESLRVKLSPYANGFVDDLPKSRTVPELGVLAVEMEKEFRRVKTLNPGAATAGMPAAGTEYIPMLLPMLDVADVSWCFLDGDFRIVSFNRDLPRITEFAGATTGVSIFDTGLNSLQSKELVRTISEARDSGQGKTFIALTRDRKEARFDVLVKSFTDPTTRKPLFGIVFNRSAS